MHEDSLGAGNPRHGSIDKSSLASLNITLSPRTVYHTTMAPSNNSTRMSFDNKFKLKAVEIAEQIGNRAAARQLRISECNVRRWRQEVEAISQAPKNKCCTKARQILQIETQVCTFIDQKRNDGLGVSRSLIRLEALRVARQLGISEADFKASPGWCTRFMNRNGYQDSHHSEEF